MKNINKSYMKSIFFFFCGLVYSMVSIWAIIKQRQFSLDNIMIFALNFYHRGPLLSNNIKGKRHHIIKHLPWAFPSNWQVSNSLSVLCWLYCRIIRTPDNRQLWYVLEIYTPCLSTWVLDLVCVCACVCVCSMLQLY